MINGGPDIRVGSARYPATPGCFIADFADNGVLLRLRYWVTKPYKIAAVESAVRTAIRRRFIDAEATLEMAYPHRQLVFDELPQDRPATPSPTDPPADEPAQGADDQSATTATDTDG